MSTVSARKINLHRKWNHWEKETKQHDYNSIHEKQQTTTKMTNK